MRVYLIAVSFTLRAMHGQKEQRRTARPFSACGVNGVKSRNARGFCFGFC